MNDTSSKILFIFAVIGGLIGFHYYADYKIDKRINDPEFIRELSAIVRPALIFDANESIQYNMGARELIEPIKVIKTGKHKDDLQIIITPKKHLLYPPLIESINLFSFTQEVTRGKDNQWIFSLTQTGCTDCEKTPLFRLEILKTH